MAIRSSRRLTGVVVVAWLIAVVHGCGGDAATVTGDSTDASVSDSTAQADAQTNDTGPTIDSGGAEGSTHDSGSLDSGTIDSGAPDTGEDTGTSTDAGDGGACPQPHPMPCGTIVQCACADGTSQIGGCANGFTCPEACCGHGGSM